MQIPSIDQFRNGLEKAQQRDTAQTLGDRTGYIGASDIGRCPRQVILSKTAPKPPDLKSLILFKRGHLAEEIVATAFQDVQPERQVELSADIAYCPACHWADPFVATQQPVHCPVCGDLISTLPLKAHCDFAFADDTIIEVKSSQMTEIQKSWEMQLQTQLFLYRRCRQRDPQGTIVMIDLARGALNFSDPYALDPDVVPDLIQRGIEIWEGIDAATLVPDPEAIDLHTEPSPLCGCCAYLGTCPAFNGEELPDDLTSFFGEYIKLANTEKEAKAKKDALRDHALTLLEPGHYTAGNLRISLFERSRTNTDMKGIAALLEELGQNIAGYQNRSAYQVLDVKAA